MRFGVHIDKTEAKKMTPSALGLAPGVKAHRKGGIKKGINMIVRVGEMSRFYFQKFVASGVFNAPLRWTIEELLRQEQRQKKRDSLATAP